MSGGERSKAGLILEGARAFGVMFTAPIVLIALVVGSIVDVAGSVVRLRAPRPAAVAILAATVVYASLIRPWHLRWGSTPEDTSAELPGDEHLPDAGTSIVHAISIDAPPAEVWPWVAQLGQDRGGFYSYEWLENMAGCGMRNADRIHPEWQSREVGETLYLHPRNGLKVTSFEPGVALGLEGWGTIALRPLDEGRTRLIVRSRAPKGIATAVYAALMEIPHFLMERRMLLGIKERAERRHHELGGDYAEGPAPATDERAYVASETRGEPIPDPAGGAR